MDRKDINKDTIERYLLQQMDAQELEDFRLLLMRDKKLQLEVEAMRLILKTVKSKSSTRAEGKKKFPLTKAWGIIIIVLLLVCGLWYFTANRQSTELMEVENFADTTRVSPPQISEPDLPSPLPIEKEPPANPVISEEEERPKKPASTPPVQSPSDSPDPNKVYAANFEPNPALERYVGTLLRGGDYHFSVDLPESIRLNEGILPFRITGTV